jgi:hypothetical protein
MQIIIKTLTDKLYTLDVSESDTIKQVKQELEKKEGIKMESQILFFGC